MYLMSEDPATDIRFPTTLSLTTPSPILSLIGIGVRTVSFLRVKVYSAAFYLESGIKDTLRDVEGWNVSETGLAGFEVLMRELYRSTYVDSPERGRGCTAIIWRSIDEESA